MKKSRKITLTVLAGLTLTGCLAAAGCGARDDDPEAVAESDEAPDHNWYDADGNAVPERWRVDECGDRILDVDGRPIPEPAVPYDRHGRVWMYHSGVWVPPIIVLGRSGYYGGPVRPVMGGGGYRGPNTATSYRAPGGVGSRPLVTPSSGPRPSAPPPARSGFGSTGAAASSGGAS